MYIFFIIKLSTAMATERLLCNFGDLWSEDIDVFGQLMDLHLYENDKNWRQKKIH